MRGDILSDTSSHYMNGGTMSSSQTSYHSKAAAEICAGCHQSIKDRYLLRVEGFDQPWHEDCLRCACCDSKLAEVGSTLFVKSDQLLCKTDYLRLFGERGQCSGCLQIIYPFDSVMRAAEHVYHVNCFCCHYCNFRFCVGDRFYLNGTKVYCQGHEPAQQQRQQQAAGRDESFNTTNYSHIDESKEQALSTTVPVA